MIELTQTVTKYKRLHDGQGNPYTEVESVVTTNKTQSQINEEAQHFLDETDWKVWRHVDEKNAGVATSLTQEEYDDLFQERQEARNLIQK